MLSILQLPMLKLHTYLYSNQYIIVSALYNIPPLLVDKATKDEYYYGERDHHCNG